MAEETLLTASRRVVRDFNIDMNHGGLISVNTQQSIETLDKYVRLEAKAEAQIEAEAANAPAEGPKLVVTLVPGTEGPSNGS